jgi:hypothetical protein
MKRLHVDRGLCSSAAVAASPENIGSPRIREEVDPDANIIVGATFDESLEGSSG